MIQLEEHLKALVEAHGPSGHETAVQAIIREAWSGLTGDMDTDGLGSLIAVKPATEPLDPPRRVMLAAHMDEIGMLVRDVIDGFVLVQNIRGVDSRVMLSQTVMVHGREPLPGVVATVPPHLSSASERKKYPDFDSLMIDLGLPAHEVEERVRIGDPVTLDVPLVTLLGRRYAGKAMDNRASVATVTVCLDALQGMRHAWDVVAVATVQEEVGLRGAATAAHHVAPDLAIALDVTFAAQPGVTGDDAVELGGGPALSFGPNFHVRLFEAMHVSAKQLEMRLQDDIAPGRSGTDAWSIQVARQGIPTALLNIPIRNMHSPVETVDARDIERAGRFLAHFIAALDADFLTSLNWTTPETESN